MAEAPNDEEALAIEAEEGLSSPVEDTVTDPEQGDKEEKEAVPFPNLEATATNLSNAGRPYSCFTEKQKWFIIVLSALAGIFSPISSNIYVPAIPTLAEAFEVSEEKINLTITVYLIFQALTPALWGSAADCFGRRPIYVICLLIYVLSCVGTALCPTNAYWLLTVMRIFQSTGGSAMIAIGAGVVADVALPQERGKYLGLFNMTSTFGPAIGPLLGGVFAGTLGWRSIFWFLTIFCSAVLVPLIFFFPETLRSLVGDGSLPPPLLNCTPAALVRRKRELRELKERGEDLVDLGTHRGKFKPWASFVLAFEPDLMLIFVWASLYYAMWYGVLTIFSTLMKNEYGASEIVIGLTYIGNGVGTGSSSVLTGRIMDYFYRREKKRVGGDHRHKPEAFQLERTRLLIALPLVVLLVVGCIALGWSFEAKAPIAVPIVLNFFVGVGTGFLTTVTIYGIDLFAGQGGAVTATFNLVRCLFGAASVSVVQIINDAMGPGWTFVLLSGICLLATPMPLIVLKWGPEWRLRRHRRAKEKEEKRRTHVREATHVSGRKAACKILPALHRDPFRAVTTDELVDAVEAHKEVVLLKAYVILTLYPKSASSYATPWQHGHFVRFFRALLQIIHSLHSLHISHEDLKRSNVLVDEAGWPVVVDFGFSHFWPNGGKVKSAGGTLDYSSPEKVARYEPRANDVWALGILLCKMLGIPHPYNGGDDDTSSAFRARIVLQQPLYELQPNHLVPGGVHEVVVGMLERDPRHRMTIPDVLAHPFFASPRRENHTFKVPSLSLPAGLARPIADSVIEDICFLKYLNREFFLCETATKVREALASPDPCWEKRWAGMFGKWEKRVEMDWEDINETGGVTRKSVSSRGNKVQTKHARALREIHLSPNTAKIVSKADGPPATPDAPATPQRVRQENVPPAAPKLVARKLKGPEAEVTPSKAITDLAVPKVTKATKNKRSRQGQVAGTAAVPAPRALPRGAFGAAKYSQVKVQKVVVQISQEADKAKSTTMTIYRDKSEAVASSDSTDPSSSLGENNKALAQKQSTDTRGTSTKPSAAATGVTTRARAKASAKHDELLSPEDIEDLEILSKRAVLGSRRTSPRLLEARRAAAK
ncbi:hypothetical protein EHS25_004364 [Saitozyma podzolica]|uniref:Major facilitator superfamily (MFS) profile domain-containing protein n=1 Tax=Saitozyma podzolica TaxID=1890683 RepID=A0A427YTW7_9TREE|nr:hypothetical protein EHS25_004364 [Saitozyma podzolica]